jgi:16S rRNA (cytosine1402-N4)-methyltransferase
MHKFHSPVLLNQAVDGLAVHPEGIYVDATFGGGGHSREILNRLKGGKLFAFDQDEEAEKNVFHDERLIFIRHNFRFLKNFLRYYKVDKVDGILADLGVSSHDFDEADRGFSFRFDAPLDMRMNRKMKLTAAGIVNSYSDARLRQIFKNYGEIRNAGCLAAAICESRAGNEIITTGRLCAVIEKCIPKASEKKYLAQVFQSLRMEVNDEIAVLGHFLEASTDVLKEGGRIVILTYHSLEDRLVKNLFKTGNMKGKPEQDFFGNFLTPFRLINRKVITPDENEIRLNPRSRSAKLRIAEKTEILWKNKMQPMENPRMV